MEFKYSLCENTWDERETEAINKVIPTGYFSNGPFVKEFEKVFASYVGSKFAVMSNSGSSANLLAVTALVYSGRLHKGDEVIVPAVSWSTTYSPLAQLGLKIRFVDIDRNTLNMDLQQLEEAITPETKAVFAVNLLGNPNDFVKMEEICNRHGILLMEDNCESLGACFNGKQAGTFGVFGTFSSFYSHHICTMEGGLTVTDDEELYHYMLAIRAHGWTRDLPESSSLHVKNQEEFYERFNFIMPGYNLRPLEMEGAIGLVQMEKLDRFLLNRRENAKYFRNEMERFPNVSMQLEVGESSWFGFAVVLGEALQGKRESFIKAMKVAGIESRPIVSGNFTHQSAVKFMDYSIYGDLKNAEYIHQNGFFIGNHSFVIREKLNYFFQSIDAILK